MKKFVIQVILLIIVIGAGLYLSRTGWQLSDLPFAPQGPVFKQLKIAGANLTVEIADTQDKKNKGLGGRASLASDSGMLFIFPEPSKYSFWMKGVNFPLDFVWIKGDTVVDLLQNIQLPAVGQEDASLPIYQPREEVDKVLEISAGTIQRLNIKVGDTVSLD